MTIPYDSTVRLRANPYDFGRAEGVLVPLNATAWHLTEPGDYRLSGTLTVTPPEGKTDAWKGVLKLPAASVKLPLRPALTDARSGITVTVKEDGRTITARDRDGETLWEADVIRTAGIPFVGPPVVRELLVTNGNVPWSTSSRLPCAPSNRIFFFCFNEACSQAVVSTTWGLIRSAYSQYREWIASASSGSIPGSSAFRVKFLKATVSSSFARNEAGR